MRITPPRRPRKASERAWPWLAFTLLASVGIVAGTYVTLAAIAGAGNPSARLTFLLISGVGAIALLLVLGSMFYSLRKRRRSFQEHLPGTLMAWLKSHVWLGAVSLVAALVHGVLRPVTPGMTSGKLALAILAAVVVVGLLWRIVYLLMPRRVARRVGNLSVEDTRGRIRELSSEIELLQAGRSPELRRAVVDLTADSGQVPHGLSREEQDIWAQVLELVRSREQFARRERTQRRYARWLQGWRWIHIPLAAALLGAIGFHLVDVFGLTRVVTGADPPPFSLSSDCAGCHSAIVADWELSMLAHSESSPIDIAQTRLALEENPELEGFCVNCHAPLGAQVSDRNVLPLDGAADGDPLIGEGVTCVTCHTVEQPPPPGRGGEDDYPAGHPGSISLGTVYGPPLDNPGPLPVPDHETATTFMNNPAEASALCGACHEVQRDLNGDGRIVLEDDLVLQTTFSEWEDFFAGRGSTGPSCVSCHMPLTQSQLVDSGPFGREPPVRQYHSHTFVGVDYDLSPSGYPNGGKERVLAEREALLRQAISLRVTLRFDRSENQMTAVVHLRNTGAGHDVPTGFAFVRQMWLEVSATTVDGGSVCLAEDSHGFRSPCASGVITSDEDDLPTCDPFEVGRGLANANVRLMESNPINSCDPWLANYQKILTDGDPDADGVADEVPYQSPRPGIVREQIRVADEIAMSPIPPRGNADISYLFDVEGFEGQEVEVRAVLRFRHLPPYFIRSLAAYYPEGITPDDLLANLDVTDMAEAVSSTRLVPG